MSADELIYLGLDTEGVEEGAIRARRAIKSVRDEAAKAPVTIKMTGDSKELVEATRRVDAAMARLDASLKTMDDNSAAYRREQTLLRSEMTSFTAVIRLLSPRVGELSEKMTGALRATQANSFAMGAIVGTTAAAGAALYKFGQFVVSTIDDVDNLSRSLTTADRERLAPLIETMQSANAATVALDGELAALQIRIAGGFADEVSDLRWAMVGLVDAMNDYDGEGGWIAQDIHEINRAILAGMTFGVSEALADLVERLRAYGRAVKETRDVGSWEDIVFDPSNMPTGDYFSAPKDEPKDRPRDILAGFTGTVTATGDAAIAANFVEEAMSEASKAARAELLAWIKFKQGREDADTEAWRARLAEEDAAYEASMKARAEALDALHQREREAARFTLQAVSDYVGAMGGLFAQLAEQGGESAMEVWRIQHASAVAQAWLAVPLAFLQGLSTGGLAGVAIGGVYAGLAAVEAIAVTAAEPPKFHTGGVLAPDEVAMGGYVGQRGEVQAVFSRSAVDRMGGDAALADAAQGRNMGGGGDTYFLLDGQRLRARQFSRPSRGFGRDLVGAR